LDARNSRDQLGILARLWKELGPDQMEPAQNLVSAVPNQTLAVAWSRKDGRIYVIYVGDARLKDTAEVLTWRGLATYYVLFVIQLETRRVTLAGITRHRRRSGWNR
jgi:hypothetical protein